MAPRSRLKALTRRALAAVTALWVVASLSFVVLRLAPGDPARSADPSIPAAERQTLRRIYGLDRPLAAQYGSWFKALASGDLGWSFHYRRPVAGIVAAALPPTLVLASLALVLQYGGALALALAASRRRRLGHALDLGTTLLYALPTFWLGLLSLRWLGQGWGWFPTFGAGAPVGASPASWLDALRYAILPATVLALAELGPAYRLTAGGLRRALAAPYALAATARGVGPARLLWRHALPNAVAPALHRFGLDLPALLGGSLVLEVLFSRPGLGRVAHQAFLARDFPLLAVGAAAAGALVVAGSLFADLAHALVDPRVRDD
jgi:peptide/nickel transport system permease protein